MEQKRSKGITFWGDLWLAVGILYALINSARNIWRLDYIALPILYVAIGIGILSLKNWARIVVIVISSLLVLSGLLMLPALLKSLKELSQAGIGWLTFALFVFLFRFIAGIGTVVFFIQPSVKNQFKKEEML